MAHRENTISVPNCNSWKERLFMNITYEKNGDYLMPNLISDPESEGELRKVWTNEKILSERAPEWHLSGDAFKWKTKGTFAYDAGTGRGAV